jgi:hypothetical protein
MGAQIQETNRSLTMFLPIGVLVVSTLLLVFFLWPRFKQYQSVRKEFLREQKTINNIEKRWQSILQKERYYRKIYANLEELTQKIGNPKTDVDYMRFFVDRNRSQDFHILAFHQLGKKKEKNHQTIAFSLRVEGRFSEIGGYLRFLENAYPLIFVEKVQIQHTRENTGKLLQMELRGKIIVLT